MSKLKELVEWFSEGICEGDGKLIMDKARALLAEEQSQNMTEDKFEKWLYDSIANEDDTQLFNCLGIVAARYRTFKAEHSHKPVGDDAQARYYNECAKNSVLYDRCCELLSELEKHDPNNPRLEQIEDEMNKNGYSLTSVAKEAEQSHTEQVLVEAIEGAIDETNGVRSMCEWELVIKLREILSRHTAKVDKGEKAVKDCGFTLATCPYERCSGITKRAEVEPLAVLADRKGYCKIEINCPRPAYRWWRILLQGYPPAEEIIEDELIEAELKARQYLEQLPDRKGE
jgi:hypothetical protein